MAQYNILIIIFILLFVGIIIYIYSNYDNSNKIQNDLSYNSLNDPNNQYDQIKKLNKKRVRFNDNVNYNTYENGESDRLSDANNNFDPFGDKIFCIDETIFDNKENSDSDINFDDSSERSLSDKKCEPDKIIPVNFPADGNEMSFNKFGIPLMSADEKKKFYAKIQKNFKNYEKSLGEFMKYQIDDSTKIITDTTIDPFAPEKRNGTGVAIKDIYDEKVSGVKAKPKCVKKRTDTGVVYENESEMNGGKISGSNLCGFDGTNNGFKSACFGNDFS